MRDKRNNRSAEHHVNGNIRSTEHQVIRLTEQQVIRTTGDQNKIISALSRAMYVNPSINALDAQSKQRKVILGWVAAIKQPQVSGQLHGR